MSQKNSLMTASAVGAKNDGLAAISQGFTFAATLDWRRLENIQAIRSRQSMVTKPKTVLKQGLILYAQ